MLESLLQSYRVFQSHSANKTPQGMATMCESALLDVMLTSFTKEFW